MCRLRAMLVIFVELANLNSDNIVKKCYIYYNLNYCKKTLCILFLERAFFPVGLKY